MDDNFDAGVTWGWYMWGNPWAGIYGQSVDQILEQLVALRLRVSTTQTAEFSNRSELTIPGWDAGIRSTCESWLLSIDAEIDMVRNCSNLAEAENSLQDSVIAWEDDFKSTGLFTFKPLATIYEEYEPKANCVRLGPNVLATYFVDERLETDLKIWAVSESEPEIDKFLVKWASAHEVSFEQIHTSDSELTDGLCLVMYGE